jgi:hypothetical protein
MGSGAMMHIPSFIKTDSAIQKLMGGDTQIHTQQRELINLLLFFQNKESRLKEFHGYRKRDGRDRVLSLTTGVWKTAEESVALRTADFGELRQRQILVLGEPVGALDWSGET